MKPLGLITYACIRPVDKYWNIKLLKNCSKFITIRGYIWKQAQFNISLSKIGITCGIEKCVNTAKNNFFMLTHSNVLLQYLTCIIPEHYDFLIIATYCLPRILRDKILLFFVITKLDKLANICLSQIISRLTCSFQTVASWYISKPKLYRLICSSKNVVDKSLNNITTGF